jgi:hypothetical protein
MTASGPLVFFVSSGRCGTQWLTEALRAVYPGRVRVEHEPLGPLYRPRRFFRRWDDPEAILAVPEVRRHVERLDQVDHYVETGWPAFAAIPTLARRFPDRLRVVHLTRHPVHSAMSHLAHSSYAGSPRDDEYTRLATLGPRDANVFYSEPAERWGERTPYERCLFWWTEVHRFGIEVEQRLADAPFLRVSAERMLSGDAATLNRLASHLGLRADRGLRARTGVVVDRWHHRTDLDFDPLRARDHPATVEVAAQLGYSFDELDLPALRERYAGEPDPGLDRIGRMFG